MTNPQGFPRNFSDRLCLLVVTTLAVCSAALCRGREAAIASYVDDIASNRWVADHFPGQGGDLPFSFVYGGRTSAELLSRWPRTQSTKPLDENRRQFTLTWTDPETALEVRCVAVAYADFPAVEWTVYFKNQGKADTAIIADIQGLDAKFARTGDAEFILHGIKGDSATQDSYQPYQITLTPGSAEERRPIDSGKSTDGPKGWPYFNLQQGDRGVLLAVGWPGQWRALFDRDAGSILRVRAGQETTRLYLKAGEEVRSPLIAILFWHGKDMAAAQNLWRRWMIAHNIPRNDGKLPGAQILGNSSHQFLEMTKATEKNQIEFVDGYLDHGIKLDYWWMDAGWYPCGGIWSKTGTWEPDPARFPHGLRPISDHALGRGVRTILWFEPERVGDPASWLATHHPEWLLKSTASDPLLNLGDPAVLTWVIDHMDGLIKSQGVHFYREDMNSGCPLMPWRENDPADRQGITENFYIQGHLAYWDALRQRNPEIRLDSCAGGGRRNDLESMRRAVPLLRSDYLFEPIGQQAHTYGLSNWLPYQGTGYLAGASAGLPVTNKIDVYAFRSTLCVSHTVSVDVRDPALDWPLLKRLEDQHPKFAPLFLHDYYPLTAYSLAPDQWMAWQFDDPERGTGMVQAFRREKCTAADMQFPLRGLDPAATYESTDLDTERVVRQSGAALMTAGLKITLSARPGAAIITYRRLD